MITRLTKRQLAALIEAELGVRHNHVRFARPRPGRWRVTWPGGQLNGPTLCACGWSDGDLARRMVHRELDYSEAKAMHAKEFGRGRA